MSATAATIAGEEDAALFGRKAKKPRAKSRRLESAVQRAVIARVRFHGVVCVHVKNEGAASMVGRQEAKKDGLLPGFPDLIAMQAPGRVAYLECKEPGWSPPPPTDKRRFAHYDRQCDAHDMLRRLGFWAGFITSQDEAVEALREAGFNL